MTKLNMINSQDLRIANTTDHLLMIHSSTLIYLTNLIN